MEAGGGEWATYCLVTFGLVELFVLKAESFMLIMLLLF